MAQANIQDSTGPRVPFHVDPKYKDKRRTMPKEPDPEKRGKNFYLRVAEAMYSSHLRNRTGLKYKDQQEFYNNRLYALGEQSTQKYIEYFFKETSAADSSGATVNRYSVDAPGGYTNSSSGAKRKGWMNMMFDIVSDAPKIVTTLVRKFEKAEYDVVVDAIDEASGVEVENEKHKLWAIKEDLEFNKQYHANMGLEFQEPEFIPESQEEIELWEDNGGFKPHHAMIQEDIINHSFQISDWGEVKKSMMEDAVTNGYFVSRVRWDAEMGKARAEYVDIARFVIQYSKHKDFHDSEYAGEFIEVPFTVLKQKGISDKELMEIGRGLRGLYDNPITELSVNQSGDISTEDLELWKAWVFDFEFITNDQEQYLKRTNKFGKSKRIKQKHGTKNATNDKQKTEILDVRTRYKARWVVGTEIIYDEGKAYDVTRQNPKEVGLSYRAYRLGTKPIIKTLIPIFDNLMILWLKYQNAISLAINDGYAIDYDAISSIKMGAGEKYSQEMIVQRFLQTGILIFKRKQSGNTRAAQTGLPVHHLPSNLEKAFTSFREGFNSNLQMIERLTGFTPMITGGAPRERAPVKTSEISVEATNDFLGNIISGYMKIKEDVAAELSLLSQIKIKQGWTESFQKVLGKRNLQVIKDADDRKCIYGYSLVARPTELERREIYESARTSLNNGRNGQPGITEADHFKIVRILENGGSLKKAEMVLQASIRRSQKEADARAKENMQLQTQGTMETEKLKHQNAIDLIVVEEEEKRKTEILKHKQAKELLALQPPAENKVSPAQQK